MSLATFNAAEWSAAVVAVLGAVGAFVTVIVNLKQGKRNAGKIEAVQEVVKEIKSDGGSKS